MEPPSEDFATSATAGSGTPRSPVVPTDARKLFDILNVPALLFVVICFFLPLCELDCGPVKAKFSGMNLAFGTDPEIEGASPKDVKGFMAREKSPTDPVFAAVPVLATLGIAVAWVAVVRPNQQLLRRQRAGNFAAVFPCLLLLLFLIYASVGFGVERKVAEEKARHGNQVIAVVDKTPWFWMAFAACAISFTMGATRGLSPTILSPHGSRDTAASSA